MKVVALSASRLLAIWCRRGHDVRRPIRVPGALYLVAMDSWAGRSEYRVEILKAGPKRSRVRWIDQAIGHAVGSESYVPNWAFTSRRQCAHCGAHHNARSSGPHCPICAELDKRLRKATSEPHS